MAGNGEGNSVLAWMRGSIVRFWRAVGVVVIGPEIGNRQRRPAGDLP